MKRKVTLCVLVFALLLTCAHAMAAKISNTTAEDGAEITKVDDQSFKVKYTGQKEKEYVVMVVSEAGIGAGGVPTKESINNNQDDVVVYMDQTKGDSSGNVEFTVRPKLDNAQSGQTYSVYMSSNESSGNAMKKVGSFTIDMGEVIKNLGDANGDSVVDGQDVSMCVDNFTKGVSLTDEQKSALDVDHSGILDGQDVSMIVDYFTKGVALQ